MTCLRFGFHQQCSSIRKVCLCLVATISLAWIVLLYFGLNQSHGNLLNSPRNSPRKATAPVQSMNESEEENEIQNDTHGRYYNFSNAVFRFYAYSAVYDDRASLLSSPVIRLIAVSDDFNQLTEQNISQLYCVLHYKTNNVVVNMTEKPVAIGYGWPLNGQEAKENIYTCPIVNGLIPTSVSISTTQTEIFSRGVPVTLPNKPKEVKHFAVCVQAVYGTIDPYRLVEWLELQKLLGVSLVGIYILSAPEEVLTVFRHYASKGFVELNYMEYIYSNESQYKEFWLHLTPAINDCIYRHMFEFEHIVIIDFDEFIMPRKHQNLLELVTHLEGRNSHVNFAFRNNYFFLDLPPDQSIPQNLTILRYRHKVKVSDEGYSVKSIINPQACINMHNHQCWSVTANYSALGQTMSVDPEIALNQHYKKCHFSKAECEKMMDSVEEDDIMLRLKENLTNSVREEVKILFGHNI